jgi:hypothetical protein
MSFTLSRRGICKTFYFFAKSYRLAYYLTFCIINPANLQASNLPISFDSVVSNWIFSIFSITFALIIKFEFLNCRFYLTAYRYFMLECIWYCKLVLCFCLLGSYLFVVCFSEFVIVKGFRCFLKIYQNRYFEGSNLRNCPHYFWL